jgi:hydroxyisourate hydrolase
MSHITTHILDTAAGHPAAGVNVVLESKADSQWHFLARGTTDADGRIPNLLPPEKVLSPGIYRLIFDTRSYFFSTQRKGFYPSVTIEFEITDGSHYHVPLLLNPFGYSTYRGS